MPCSFRQIFCNVFCRICEVFVFLFDIFLFHSELDLAWFGLYPFCLLHFLFYLSKVKEKCPKFIKSNSYVNLITCFFLSSFIFLNLGDTIISIRLLEKWMKTKQFWIWWLLEVGLKFHILIIFLQPFEWTIMVVNSDKKFTAPQKAKDLFLHSLTSWHLSPMEPWSLNPQRVTTLDCSTSLLLSFLISLIVCFPRWSCLHKLFFFFFFFKGSPLITVLKQF